MTRDGKALLRIVALLFALADLTERAAAVPLARRAVVLAVLRHAEAIGWAFALGAPCVSSACGRDRRQARDGMLFEASDCRDGGPAELARLAFSLRLLALVVAGWAIEAHSPTAVVLPGRRARAPRRPAAGGSWRGPAALPAPDTS